MESKFYNVWMNTRLLESFLISIYFLLFYLNLFVYVLILMITRSDYVRKCLWSLPQFDILTGVHIWKINDFKDVSWLNYDRIIRIAFK
jgi:hypothetical protein